MSATILVADDDPDYVELTSMILRKNGYEVIMAHDGTSAWEELKKHQPDVLLVDWNMPGMNGIDFIKSVKADDQYGDRYAIMVTARNDPQAKAEGLGAGADDYLTKPFDRLELLARVRVGLRTRSLQKALADEVRMLHRAVEQSPVSIVITDTHGTIEYVNRQFTQVTGYSFSETIGKNPRILKSGEKPSHEYAQLWSTITAGREWRGEFHNKKKNGELHWEHVSISPIKNEKGEVTHFLAVKEDITERKQSEDALRESEERTRLIVEMAHDAFVAIDAQSTIVDWNSQAECTFGWSRAEAVGRPLAELIIPPNHRDAHLHGIQRYLFTGEGPALNKRIEITALHRDGHEFPVEMTITPIHWNETVLFSAFLHDITERKRTEEAIRQAELQFRLVWEKSADGMRLTNEQGIVQKVNEAFCRMVEKPREAIEGKPLSEIYAEVQQEHILERHLERFRSRTVSPHLEREMTLWNGKKIWFETTNSFFEIEGQRPLLLGIFRDITERKRTEEAMANLRGQLELIFNSVGEGIHGVDLSGNFIFVNHAGAEMLGWTMNELIGKHSHTTMHHTRADGTPYPKEECNVYATLHDGRARRVSDEVFWRKDGTSFPVEYLSTPMRDHEGKLVGAVVTFRDITMRRRAEEELRQSEEQFRLISENGADMISLLDEQGNYLYASRSYANLGHDPQQLVGANLFTYIHPDDVPRVRDEINAVVNSFQTRSMEFRFQQKDGAWCPVESAVSLLINDAGLRLVAVARNITDRVRREEERQSLESQLKQRNQELEQTVTDLKHMQGSLVQSEKMASIGQLTAGIAHEINNPLAFVSSNLNRFKEYFDDTLSLMKEWQALGKSLEGNPMWEPQLRLLKAAEQQADLDFIAEDFGNLMHHSRDGAERIKSIVERLRGFSHLAGTEFGDANINEAIDDTLTIVWNELKYKAEINKEYGALPLVSCNVGELKQVFINLMVNAAHAIQDRGEITLRTSLEGKRVVIQISDTGNGIAPDNLKKIFDPFFTTKPVGKGTGLGLWISATIIQKHKGTMTVESELGRGTTFTIKLPIEQEEKLSGGLLTEEKV